MQPRERIDRNSEEKDIKIPDLKALRERERRFREKGLPFEVFTIKTKTRWWNRVELQNVLSYLDPEGGEDVIDVGCSDGRFLGYLYGRFPGCRLFGIDFARNSLKVLKNKGFRSHIVCGDICEMPFKPGSFDHAVAVQVIQQIPSREERIKVLRDINRMLRDGGTMVVTLLNQKAWYHLVKGGKEGPLITAEDLCVYLYDPADIRREFEEAGFSVSRIAGINNLPAGYLKRLGILGVWLDIFITRFFRSLSLEKGCYLIALCKKK